jgi:hypothetical protein
VPHPFRLFLRKGWESKEPKPALIPSEAEGPAALSLRINPQENGCPILPFVSAERVGKQRTQTRSHPEQSRRTCGSFSPHQSARKWVPHPFRLFLRKGWESKEPKPALILSEVKGPTAGFPRSEQAPESINEKERGLQPGKKTASQARLTPAPQGPRGCAQASSDRARTPHTS